MVFVYKTLITGPTDLLPWSELKPDVMAVTLLWFQKSCYHITNVNFILIESFQFQDTKTCNHTLDNKVC